MGEKEFRLIIGMTVNKIVNDLDRTSGKIVQSADRIDRLVGSQTSQKGGVMGTRTQNRNVIPPILRIGFKQFEGNRIAFFRTKREKFTFRTVFISVFNCGFRG